MTDITQFHACGSINDRENRGPELPCHCILNPNTYGSVDRLGGPVLVWLLGDEKKEKGSDSILPTYVEREAVPIRSQLRSPDWSTVGRVAPEE